ncbi:sphingomyelinase C-like [Lytechinus pictus]|uniref:sphingomyelinase C-like n=1 Tax=Lytechinus pictus TaxID=7653 RepID=UPI0030B9FC08
MTVFRKTLLITFSLIISTIIQSAADQDCEIQPEDTPSVWLGDEDDVTYCEAEPYQCSNFGLVYVCEDPSGGSLEPCANGTKVLCSAPDPIPLDDPTPSSELRVVIYNIWELRYLYYQNGQRERTCRILHELFGLRQDIDVIVFNEAFMGGCFSKFNSTVKMSTLTIRDILVQHEFIYHTKTVGEVRELPKFENGGVFIASRWPIISEDETIYTEAIKTTADALSAKGAKYARVLKSVNGSSRYYNIFGTHLQASKGVNADRVRVSQATEMHDLVVKLALSSGESVIYAGDLNTNYYDREPRSNTANIIEALHALVPPIIGELNYTTDGLLNDARDGDSASYKDYVIYHEDYLHPLTASQEILRPRASEFFEVCMEAITPFPTYADSDRCRKTQNITDLADHFAVIGVYKFDNKAVTTESSEPSTTNVVTHEPTESDQTTKSDTTSSIMTTDSGVTIRLCMATFILSILSGLLF